MVLKFSSISKTKTKMKNFFHSIFVNLFFLPGAFTLYDNALKNLNILLKFHNSSAKREMKKKFFLMGNMKIIKDIALRGYGGQRICDESK
jgi:hypothetical protein